MPQKYKEVPLHPVTFCSIQHVFVVNLTHNPLCSRRYADRAAKRAHTDESSLTDDRRCNEI